jgi:hypothetical protein
MVSTALASGMRRSNSNGALAGVLKRATLLIQQYKELKVFKRSMARGGFKGGKASTQHENIIVKFRANLSLRMWMCIRIKSRLPIS